MKRKIRWIVSDEVENSIHKTRKNALKEYNRLLSINYRYKSTLEVLRHNQITDNYTVIK